MNESSADTSFSLARLAVEFWRLLRAYDRLRASVEGEAGARFAAQSRFALTRLEALLTEAGLRIAVFDGQPFHPGLPVRALNAEDFVEEEGLIVAFTNEPTILAEGRVVVLGTVTLDRRVEGAI
jgi:hypothetical protein